MKILLLGKDGQLGWELQRALAPLGALTACGRNEADLANSDQLRQLIRHIAPDVIVNAAAYTAVDLAETESERAHQINAYAVGVLAEEANALGAWLIHYSTDYVFDGTKTGAYAEDDITRPLSVYGQTKLDGEQAIATAHDKYLIFRTSWVFGRHGGNFAKTMLKLAAAREKLNIVSDQVGVPTSTTLIADVTALILYQLGKESDGMLYAGVYHLASSGQTSWFEYATYLISLAREKGMPITVAKDQIFPIPASDYPTPATRPQNSRLDTQKITKTFGVHMQGWQEQVRRLVDEL